MARCPVRANELITTDSPKDTGSSN